MRTGPSTGPPHTNRRTRVDRRPPFDTFNDARPGLHLPEAVTANPPPRLQRRGAGTPPPRGSDRTTRALRPFGGGRPGGGTTTRCTSMRTEPRTSRPHANGHARGDRGHAATPSTTPRDARPGLHLPEAVTASPPPRLQRRGAGTPPPRGSDRTTRALRPFGGGRRDERPWPAPLPAEPTTGPPPANRRATDGLLDRRWLDCVPRCVS